LDRAQKKESFRGALKSSPLRELFEGLRPLSRQRFRLQTCRSRRLFHIAITAWLARVGLMHFKPQAKRLILCLALAIAALCTYYLSARRVQSRLREILTAIGDAIPFYWHSSFSLPLSKITGCEPDKLIDADPAGVQYLCQSCWPKPTQFLHRHPPFILHIISRKLEVQDK
jgi:hypothetical protein